MAGFLVPLISGLAGGLLNRPSTQQQKTDQTTTTNQSENSTASGSQLPVYDPLQLQMRNFLINQFYNQTNPGAIHGLVSSTINNGVNSINDAAGPQEAALKASLAARGLNFSGTAGTALAGQQAGRIHDITTLRGQQPLMEANLQQSRLTDFSNYLKGLPTGTATNTTSSGTSEGTSHTVGTGQVQSPGNIAGGAAGGLGGALGLMYGMGAFNKKQLGQDTIPQGNMNVSGGGTGVN